MTRVPSPSFADPVSLRTSSGAALATLGAVVAVLLLVPSTPSAQYPNPSPPTQPETPVPGTSQGRPRFSVDGTVEPGGGVPRVRLDYRLARSELLFERRPTGYHAAYEVRATPGGDVTHEDLAAFTFGATDWPTIVFVNGVYAPALSSLGNLPDGVRIQDFATAIKDGDPLVERHLSKIASYELHAFTALNSAFALDGAVVRIAKEADLDVVRVGLDRWEMETALVEFTAERRLRKM
jgi:hypothetical protein